MNQAATDQTAGKGVAVLFVCPVAHFYGGAERVLADMLANPAVRPHLCVPAEGPLAEYARARGIPCGIVDIRRIAEVHRPVRPGAILSAARDAWRAAGELRALARRFGCPIVHTNGLKAHVVGALARRRGGAGPFRLVAHFHDIPYTRLERAIWRFVTTAADAVIAVSRPCLPGPDRRHVTILPNALPVPAALPERTPRTPLRLGFVGRYAKFKGLGLLLDWFEAAREAGIDAMLRLRGRTTPEDQAYWDGIQARIAASPCAAAIVDEGFRDRAELYDDLDLVLVPSDHPDPHPFVVKEAQAEGLPVVAYPAGGIPDMIADGHTGFLAATPAEFVAVLRRLEAEPGLYDRVRRTAWEKARAEFDMATFHDRLARVYAGLDG